MNKNKTPKQSRRKFIISIAPACAFFCLGISNILAKNYLHFNEKNDDGESKAELCLSYERAFKWKYNDFIDMMAELSNAIGNEKLIELLKNGKDNIKMRGAKNDPNFKLSEFGNSIKNSKFFKNTIKFEILENSDKLFEVTVTECLWAKTFREKNADEIGYASICYGDFSDAKAMHPNLKLERTKTLMQGFECCNFRYVFE